MEAIRLAGNEHPFVNTIVQALPSEVLSNGVMTKDGLVDRFDKVSKDGRFPRFSGIPRLLIITN